MRTKPSENDPTLHAFPKRAWTALAWPFVPPLVIGLILRAVLDARFGDELGLAARLGCHGLGLSIDLLVAATWLSPLLAAHFLLRPKWTDHSWWKVARFGLYSAALTFHAFVQFCFFEEFAARFNHIALDYALFPHEVVGNVSESYPVPIYLAGALSYGVAAALIFSRARAAGPRPRLAWRTRWLGAGSSLAIGLASIWVLKELPLSFSQSRVQSEITSNGTLQLVRAYFTGSLDYGSYYTTLPEAEAWPRAARVLGFPEPSQEEIAGNQSPLIKPATQPFAPRPLNVAVIVEESFGSDFVGALGAKREACTPELDRWSREGLLLTHLIANGNRTVRGLEGVLCSFVPLPGDAVLKRDKSENVATLARIFRSRGYRTTFLYGGRGLFDGLRPFALDNGWDDFVEQSDFTGNEFGTVWGVSDQFTFDALLARQLLARAEGEPLFATLLTVSNHKPYDIPEGNPIWRPGNSSRSRAVAYADWSLGRYLDAARTAGVLDDTVVLVVGDHGARVYGSADIPVESYRIPALFVTPHERWRGARIERLCSQIDLAPTLLSLAGIAHSSPFLGTCLLDLPAKGGRAIMHHNRDIGILTDRALVVLGLQKSVSFFTRKGRDATEFRRVDDADIGPELRELERDAAAVFQVAHELYESRRYRLPDESTKFAGASQ